MLRASLRGYWAAVSLSSLSTVLWWSIASSTETMRASLEASLAVEAHHSLTSSSSVLIQEGERTAHRYPLHRCATLAHQTHTTKTKPALVRSVRETDPTAAPTNRGVSWASNTAVTSPPLCIFVQLACRTCQQGGDA
jgi:hypothetical protein